MLNELGISAGTALIVLIALYFVIKWAVRNGIEESRKEIRQAVQEGIKESRAELRNVIKNGIEDYYFYNKGEGSDEKR